MLRRACATHGWVRPRSAATPSSAKARRCSACRAAYRHPSGCGARKKRVRLASIGAAMVGLTLIGVLVGYFGADAVIRSMLAIGWAGFVTICLIHLALMAVMGIAWWALLPGTKLWISIWGRLVRDAGSEVLPLSQVGGYLLGARAVAFAGVPGVAAAASTIVDVSLEFVAQIAFTGMTLAWLAQLRPDAPVIVPVAVGLAVAGILAAGLLAVQRRGFDLIDRLAGAF